MFGYVYKITLPNGYTYIGSHESTTFDENYWGSSTNSQYWKALFKAGKENVKREVLSWHETREDMLLEEYRQIQLHPNGYNIAHLKKTKEEKMLEKASIKRQLLLDKLDEAKEMLCSKLNELDIKMKEIMTLSDEDIIKIKANDGIFRIGRISWNKGKTKENDIRIKKGSDTFKERNHTAWNKGKTYEEMYGKERAEEIKLNLSKHAIGKIKKAV